MVSIEDKFNYMNRISDSPKLLALHQMLIGKAITQPHGNDLSEVDEIYFGIISAIQSNTKSEFEKHYSKKNKSNPSKESPAPFVNDDFLIFSIILGVLKFKLEKSWIKNIVSMRSKNSISNTLDNLLAENYYSTSNLPEIVFVFLQNVNPSLITNDFMNSTFTRINENISLFDNKSDFQILCAIHTYNLIIQLKVAPEGSEIQRLQRFQIKFIKRTKYLTWILQAILWVGLLYGLLNLPVYSPATIELINQYGYVFTILGAFGFTLLGAQLKFIRQKSHELTMRLLGYPRNN